MRHKHAASDQTGLDTGAYGSLPRGQDVGDIFSEDEIDFHDEMCEHERVYHEHCVQKSVLSAAQGYKQ